MYYNIQISETSAFSDLSVNKIVENVTIDVITYGLEPGIKYYWRVKSINNQTGKESDWSSVCYFYTRPSDIIINQGGVDDEIENINVIYFELGYNKSSTYFAPNGIIADNMCRSLTACCESIVKHVPVGEDTLGYGLCGQYGSELL